MGAETDKRFESFASFPEEERPRRQLSSRSPQVTTALMDISGDEAQELVSAEQVRSANALGNLCVDATKRREGGTR
jgi:hypothetical protein